MSKLGVWTGRIGFAVAACLVAFPAATAQTPQSYRGEPVLSASGEVVAPWVEKRGCRKGTQDCVTLVLNPDTQEIALIGERLSSRFERTGNGQEIRRAETARDKAHRLSATPG